MAPAVATYESRDPSSTVLYQVIAEHLETFLASLNNDPDAKGLPAYVQREFYDYLRCGILAHGFLRLGCDTCKKEVLLPFSCKRLLRYTARGAVSLERLAHDASGDLLYRFRRPWSDGTTGIKLSALELIEKLAALVPPPHAHLIHYSGCLAPNSKLRAQLIPSPRQRGVDSEEAKSKAPYWSWARLLGRVFDLAMSSCPFCRRGALHLMSAITQEEVTTRILRHLKLASVPPPIAPARQRQEIFVFDEGPVSVGA